ncbi:hypothetical protein BZB76_5435 [Actinomadura pelletieri DSM 43383]|uniref:NAD glycohydrolase translocation F5/8 type C domain-containing protein n=1 Tax=Actinomadura pelletieri DSM 43383 TaxID=1120940 RepID=A0A495QGF4_9ACTN|nr:zinc ribbon domain-containing protein [Actinomadura pelletieri]RKS70955.1 hypothetical protein BZB76_5435 [Actinomadura pelletieri DSM 43383]
MTTAGICGNCGATHQGGSFCDRCGAVLSWAKSEDPARPTASSTHPDPVPGPPPPDRVPGPPNPAPAPPTAPPPVSAEPPPTAIPGQEPGDVRVFPQPGRRPARDERARRLVIPVAPENPAAAAPGPAPVLPGRPEPARPQVRRAERADWSGGIPCPWCDTPNPPGRNFCRQCAMALSAADKDGYRTRTWWQRLFGGDVPREAPWAGERPRLRRGGRARLLSWAALVLLAVPLVWTAAVKTDDAVNGVVDHFVKRAPAPTSAAKASHTDPKHGPKFAFDALKNTFWGTGHGGSGQNIFLEATFAQPRRLLNVIITSGMSTQPDKYATQARPQSLHATVFSSDGSSRTTTLHLDDVPGPQKLKLRGDNVVRVRLTIRSAYGVADDRQVCIAEVEFFTRSTAKTL